MGVVLAPVVEEVATVHAPAVLVDVKQRAQEAAHIMVVRDTTGHSIML